MEQIEQQGDERKTLQVMVSAQADRLLRLAKARNPARKSMGELVSDALCAAFAESQSSEAGNL